MEILLWCLFVSSDEYSTLKVVVLVNDFVCLFPIPRVDVVVVIIIVSHEGDTDGDDDGDEVCT